MKKLLAEIRSCDHCRHLLPHQPRPVLSVSSRSKIIVIGQAPGRKVHASGVPWDDQSGKILRGWLGVEDNTFYDVNNFAIIPMGFCYPGHGLHGDLPPRPECAGKWHPVVFPKLKKASLTLLIGWYAQKYYLGESAGPNLTETVKNFRKYLPHYFPLVHPSPRNGIWQRRNPWFMNKVVPELRARVEGALKNTAGN